MIRFILIPLSTLLMFVIPSAFADAPKEKWRIELANNKINDLVFFEGELYGVGESDNPEPPAGNFGWLFRLSGSGELRWNRELHVASNTIPKALAVDASGVYFAGNGFIVKYSHAGDPIWTLSWKEFAEANLPESVLFNAMTLDENGLYVAGRAHTDKNYGFLMRVNFNGEIQWSHLVGNQSRDGITGVVVHDGIVYAVGAEHLYKYRNDGSHIENVPLDFKPRDITYNNNFLYLTGLTDDGKSGGIPELIAKYDLEGHRSWIVPHHPDNSSYGTVLAANGSYLYTYSKLNAASNNHNLHLDRYDLDGKRIQEWNELNTPIEKDFYPASIVKADGKMYVAGSYYPLKLAGFVAEISGFDEHSAADRFPVAQIQPLEDINEDGYQDIALLSRTASEGGTSPLTVQVKSVDSVSLNYVINFDLDGDIADFRVLPDLNSNGIPELAVLSTNPARVEIRDGKDGNSITSFQLNGKVVGLKLLPLPDLNGNGKSELGILTKSTSAAGSFVEIRDGNDAQLLYSLPFNPAYVPRDLALVNDLDSDGLPEIGVLSVDEFSHLSKVEIRSLTGKLINNLWPGRKFESSQLVTFPGVPVIGPVEANSIGVLQSKIVGDGRRIKVMDPASGTEIRTTGLNWRYQSVEAVLLSDISGTGDPELAILGAGFEEKDGFQKPANKIEVRDSFSGILVNNIWNIPDGALFDLAILPDINGNQTPETATLLEQDESLKVYIRDSRSNALIDVVEFGPNLTN